jgi:hypothetical protein
MAMAMTTAKRKEGEGDFETRDSAELILQRPCQGDLALLEQAGRNIEGQDPGQIRRGGGRYKYSLEAEALDMHLETR